MNLQQWIDRASRGLAPESKARVRVEIEEHYRCAMEEPCATEVSVLQALGDPRAANRAYKRVLVTTVEARLMHWNAVGDRHPRLALALFLVCALGWAQMGTLSSAWVALVLVYEGFLVALPRRGRPYTGWGLVAYRCARLIWGTCFFWAVGATPYFPAPIMSVVLAPLVFYCGIEWVNFRIRRKLPVEHWPKAIYLF